MASVKASSGKLLSATLLVLLSGKWFFGPSINSSSLSRSCKPFEEPGALFLDLEDSTKTIWKPFDTSCSPSHLLPYITALLEADSVNKQEALPWLANRTMVLIGDSIDRFNLDFFCEHLGGELSLIEPNHLFSPPPFKNGRDEHKENQEIMNTWTADGRPHRCFVNQGGLNFNMISFFMYGLGTWDDFVQQDKVFLRPHYYAPVEVAARIHHWVLGVLQRAGLSPDVVEFSSGFWDLMHFSEIDGATSGSEDSVHMPFPTSERLDWYRTRLNAALDMVEGIFNNATLIWRRGHEVGCGQFHVPCARNAQFISVANHVISQRRSRWRVDETGALLRGHLEFFKDRIHPGSTFGGLWTDAILYHLRESFYDRSNL